jgi:glycosyltransferase involved in cell wall biosynthesis
MMPTPRVLLLTGAYYPEISAAAVLCRAVAASLDGRVRFSVVTTAVDPALPAAEVIEDVPVYRVPVDVRSRLSKARAAARLVWRLVECRHTFDVLHLHGCSQKNVPATLVARALGIPIVLTLHTAGQDEPEVVRQKSRLGYWAFRSADLVLSVSPYLSARYRDGGLSEARLRLTPNGIDTRRFRPASAPERLELRRALGWPEDQPVVLFVGFFSRDKRPDLVFRAWRRLAVEGVPAVRLVYVGATGPTYYEIDSALASQIRAGAADLGAADRVEFVDPTNAIDRYLRAADVFVMPSVRESQGVALLEAMACGLPSIASRLPGATDMLIEDGVNGRLFPVDDEAALAAALRDVLNDRPRAAAMGARARESVVARYDIAEAAERWRAAYAELIA